MKIQFFGENCFSLSDKKATVVFDPNQKCTLKNVDFVTNSGQFKKATQTLSAKKTLSLPGEFEISGVLVRGFYSRPENVVYKVTCEDVACAHFGTLEKKPSPEFFEKLGENIDIVLLNLNEKFTPKDAKELIETLEPRWTIIGGDQSLFPKMIEEGAKLLEENNFSVSSTALNEEKTEILILST
ncbi:MBL fold metallo-hydrolase [Candidatus Gracilibacteria bacterium]|nr:MBL fold metallo-hydrolase [Candidatus Gracilibacteria bacterium]